MCTRVTVFLEGEWSFIKENRIFLLIVEIPSIPEGEECIKGMHVFFRLFKTVNKILKSDKNPALLKEIEPRLTLVCLSPLAYIKVAEIFKE